MTPENIFAPAKITRGMRAEKIGRRLSSKCRKRWKEDSICVSSNRVEITMRTISVVSVKRSRTFRLDNELYHDIASAISRMMLSLIPILSVFIFCSSVKSIGHSYAHLGYRFVELERNNLPSHFRVTEFRTEKRDKTSLNNFTSRVDIDTKSLADFSRRWKNVSRLE